MISTLLALVLASTEFAGGNGRDLAKAIFDDAKQPVSIAVTEVRPIAKFTFDASELKTLSAQLKAYAGLTQSPGVIMAYSDGMIPRLWTQVNPVYSTAEMVSGNFDSTKAAANGVVNVDLPAGSWLTRQKLYDMKFEKNLKCHWAFDKFNLAVFAKDMPEREFLTLVAKSAGFKFGVVAKDYIIDLDPVAFKGRALTTFKTYASTKQLANVRDIDRWSCEMAVMALNLATPNQIKEAFDTQGSSALIVLDQGTKQALYNQMGRYASTADSLANAARGDQRPRMRPTNVVLDERSGTAGMSGFFSLVDWRQDVGLRLMSNFHVQVQAFANAGPRGSRPINLEFGGSAGRSQTLEFPLPPGGGGR